MLQYILLGGGLAFAAAIQPGPLQAFLVNRVTVAGWKRTLPACLSPLLSDGPIALLALLVLGSLSTTVQQILRASGGVLLLYFAWSALRQWRRPAAPGSTGSAPRTLLEAAVVNLLNPNPYLGWTLVLGPSVLVAWGDRPANAVALLAAFYGTLVCMLAVFIILVGTSRFLGPRIQHALVLVSALLLAGLGIYLLVTAGEALLLAG